jgi:hypothetical protein
MADEVDLQAEEEYLSSENATELWAIVRDATQFTRWVVEEPDDGDDYNHRLLYLLAAAVFGRVAPLVKHRAFTKLIRVMEKYAEGKATDDQFEDAYDKADAISTRNVPAARTAAINSIHLVPDDYKVLEGVDFVTDAAGYLAAIESGDLATDVPYDVAKSVWKTPAFLAGKVKEERAICAVIRDIFGNPFPRRPASTRTGSSGTGDSSRRWRARSPRTAPSIRCPSWATPWKMPAAPTRRFWIIVVGRTNTFAGAFCESLTFDVLHRAVAVAVRRSQADNS